MEAFHEHPERVGSPESGTSAPRAVLISSSCALSGHPAAFGLEACEQHLLIVWANHADIEQAMSAIDRADDARANSVPIARNVWIRKPRRTLGFATCAFLNSAFWIWMLVNVASKPRFVAHNGGLLPFVVFFLVVALGSAAAGRRLARCGLWIGSEGIVVRGPLRTRRLTVQDVERIEPGVQRPGDAGNGTPCPILRLADGSAVGVWALGTEGLRSGYRRHLEDMQPMCDQLNQLLISAKSARLAEMP